MKPSIHTLSKFAKAIPLLVLLAIAASLDIYMYKLHDCKFPAAVLTLSVTGLFILRYTAVTARMYCATRDNVAMSCFTQIHNVMTDKRAYASRAALYTQLEHGWHALLRKKQRRRSAPTADLLDALDGSNIERAAECARQVRHATFHDVLRSRRFELGNGEEANLLEALEHTLLALDVIAVPHAFGITQAEQALMAYGPVFDRTAQFLLPFVWLERQLRSQMQYKYYYLLCLQSLGCQGALTLDDRLSAYLQELLEKAENPPGDVSGRTLSDWGPMGPIRPWAGAATSRSRSGVSLFAVWNGAHDLAAEVGDASFRSTGSRLPLPGLGTLHYFFARAPQQRRRGTRRSAPRREPMAQCGDD